MGKHFRRHVQRGEPRRLRHLRDLLERLAELHELLLKLRERRVDLLIARLERLAKRLVEDRRRVLPVMSQVGDVHEELVKLGSHQSPPPLRPASPRTPPSGRDRPRRDR